MAQTTIAIVSDCDDTLAPDTTGQLLTHYGVEPEQFFRESGELVKRGWDPTLAYMHHMVELARGGPLSPCTADAIIGVGRNIKFHKGAPGCFPKLKEDIENEDRFRDVGIRVETYVISSGLEELLQASSLGSSVHSIWGSLFEYGDNGVIAHPKRAISFTDKTRYVFLIQKGKVANEFRSNPYTVNEPMGQDERPVPFTNMIYVGDGASDIPAMSLVDRFGGTVVGILSQENPGKTWELGYGRRANITVPPDFEPGGYAYDYLLEALRGKAESIRSALMGHRFGLRS